MIPENVFGFWGSWYMRFGSVPLPGYGAVEDWIWTSSRSSNSIGASSLGCSRKECSVLIEVSFSRGWQNASFLPTQNAFKDVWWCLVDPNITFRTFDQKNHVEFLKDLCREWTLHVSFPMPVSSPTWHPPQIQLLHQPTNATGVHRNMPNTALWLPCVRRDRYGWGQPTPGPTKCRPSRNYGFLRRPLLRESKKSAPSKKALFILFGGVGWGVGWLAIVFKWKKTWEQNEFWPNWRWTEERVFFSSHFFVIVEVNLLKLSRLTLPVTVMTTLIFLSRLHPKRRRT